MNHIAIFAFAVVLLSGCGNAQQPAPDGTAAAPQSVVANNGQIAEQVDTQVSAQVSAQVTLQRAKWAALTLLDYDYQVQRTCFCTPEYTAAMRVEVRAGQVKRGFYVHDESPVSARVLRSLRTVDQWFDYIARGYQRPFHKLVVRYHENQGYPVWIEADVNPRLADDEQKLTFTNLVSL